MSSHSFARMAGPMVIPGYWNNPEATGGAFAGGYWKSGDLGAIDEEGYLQLFDRKKDMINRGGFKIYSVEVENLLMSHPAVVEAGVVGRPCPVLGERAEAFVVTTQDIAEAELRAYCSDRLSDYKVPDHIVRIEGALPRNANGNLQKSELRAWLEKKDESAA
jgi:long-chain acyl-CoA synthetase